MITTDDWYAIHVLSAAYWQRVDRISSEPVDDLYIETGVMRLNRLILEGRQVIRRFFIDRNIEEQRALRTTRHITGALTLERISPTSVRVYSTVQVLSGIGQWPLVSEPPSSVADFMDIVTKSDNGSWLYASRTATTIFTGPGAASFAR